MRHSAGKARSLRESEQLYWPERTNEDVQQKNNNVKCDNSVSKAVNQVVKEETVKKYLRVPGEDVVIGDRRAGDISPSTSAQASSDTARPVSPSMAAALLTVTRTKMRANNRRHAS